MVNKTRVKGINFPGGGRNLKKTFQGGIFPKLFELESLLMDFGAWLCPNKNISLV